ncbi:hypothetical protein PENTCL1PPCAC_6859, partial [Pristionchus entomophagus]
MHLSLLLISLFIISEVSFSSHLSCDFNSECCWSSPMGQKWVRRHRIGINDYMRTFMVGRGRPPPKSNFIVRAQKGGESLYESCSFCSENGVIHIQYRHWQSPSADLRICWRLSNETLSPDRCQKIGGSRQSQLISQQIVVPQRRDVKISFILARSNDKNSEGVAMLDKISLKTALCNQEDVSPPGISALPPSPSPPSPPSPPHLSLPPSIPPPPTASLPPLSTRIQSSDPSSPFLDHQTLEEKKPPTATTAFAAKSNVIPPSPGNPLTDLLGDDFVKFLDPNYESEDDYKEEEENGETEEIIVTTSTISTTTNMIRAKNPHHHNPSHEILHETDECSTKGGCLFDRAFCTYTQQEGITHQTPFTLTKIGTSSFAQATVPPNNVSVIETRTKMSKDHVILFDALIFEPNTRMAGCCFHPKNPLSCSYTLPSLMPVWQTARFDCKPGTTKLMFLCENYSNKPAVCAIDNVRIHLMSDIFFLEPCQKRQL